MKKFNIRFSSTSYENYSIEAETYEEAVAKAKSGKLTPYDSDSVLDYDELLSEEEINTNKKG